SSIPYHRHTVTTTIMMLSFVSPTLPPPTSPLFPYTTLFRSIRYRDADGKPQTAATLNGTLCAIARTIACLLEVHQREDGSVHVPAALRSFLGGVAELTPGMALATAVPAAVPAA